MGKVPQITKKPISKNVRVWTKEVEGWRRFIAGVQDRARAEGQAWADNMAKYAKTRLADLLAHDPRPVKVKARRKRA